MHVLPVSLMPQSLVALIMPRQSPRLAADAIRYVALVMADACTTVSTPNLQTRPIAQSMTACVGRLCAPRILTSRTQASYLERPSPHGRLR